MEASAGRGSGVGGTPASFARAGSYYDIARSANQTQFDALRALVPASDILFGSDYPWNPGSSLVVMTAALLQLRMSEQDLTLILQGNSAKLFPGPHGRCFGHQIVERSEGIEDSR